MINGHIPNFGVFCVLRSGASARHHPLERRERRTALLHQPPPTHAGGGAAQRPAGDARLQAAGQGPGHGPQHTLLPRQRQNRGSLRGGRAQRRGAHPGQRPLHAGQGVRAVREGGGPQRHDRGPPAPVDGRGEALHHGRQTTPTVLHAEIRGHHPREPAKGLRHHRSQGQVLRRPGDPLHPASSGQRGGTFNIGPTTGVVKLAERPGLRGSETAKVLLTHSHGHRRFRRFLNLCRDVNDNAPRFELPDYQAHNVDEDVAVGTSILQVSASDMDQNKNAEIEYSLDKEDFTIDNKGVIYSNKRLDADINNTYVLTVRATDRGDPPLTGTATVRIYTENKNDEPPKFSQDVYTPNVDENAGPNTLVTTVVASDKDGDNIYFGFVGGGTVSGMFQIEERTGVIRLISGHIQLDKDKYELNVTARDDGACCKNGALTTHTSTALVVVFITDVNDNKPLFEECSTYAPKWKKGRPAARRSSR
ncbi:neural-cadherin [Caerostris extrusa]|uniref:Neural-cadherin n=1 Tax=Caerostris extrusa TaxID=172846 RepID=A0AAV4Q8W7_CAEEX|nr:neural-cadherin [Caerostris extrusa]